MVAEIKNEFLDFVIQEDERVILYNVEHDFEIPLCIQAVKFFSPVLTAALETPLNIINTTSDIPLNIKPHINASAPCIENDSDLPPKKRACSDSSVIPIKNIIDNRDKDIIDDRDKQRRDHKFANCCRINIIGFDETTVERFVRLLHGYGSGMEFNWSDLVKMLKITHFYGVEKFFTLCKEKGKEMINFKNLVEVFTLIEVYEIDEWLDACSDVLKCCNNDNIDTYVWKCLMENHSKIMADVLSRYINKRTNRCYLCVNEVTYI